MFQSIKSILIAIFSVTSIAHVAVAQMRIVDPEIAFFSKPVSSVAIGVPVINGNSVSPPVLSDGGFVAFAAQFSIDNGSGEESGVGLWRYTHQTSSLELIATSNTVATGSTNTSTFVDFRNGQYNVDTNGNIVSIVELSDGHFGIWYFPILGTSNMVVAEEFAPTSVSGEYFGSISRPSLVDGVVAFYASVTRNDQNPSPGERVFLWSEQNGLQAGPGLRDTTNIPCADSEFVGHTGNFEPRLVGSGWWGTLHDNYGSECSSPSNAGDVIIGLQGLQNYYALGTESGDRSGDGSGLEFTSLFRYFDGGPVGMLAGSTEDGYQGIWYFLDQSQSPGTQLWLKTNDVVTGGTVDGPLYGSEMSNSFFTAGGTTAASVSVGGEGAIVVGTGSQSSRKVVVIEGGETGPSCSKFWLNPSAQSIFHMHGNSTGQFVFFTKVDRSQDPMSTELEDALYSWDPVGGLRELVSPGEFMYLNSADAGLCGVVQPWVSIPPIDISLGTSGLAGRSNSTAVWDNKGFCGYVLSVDDNGVTRTGIAFVRIPDFDPACSDVDYNNDGSIFDPQDIADFLTVYQEGDCPSDCRCDSIDFNADCSIFDPVDIDAFLSVYSEGPCLF